MRRFLYENSLSLVAFWTFAAILIAQSVVGYHAYSQDREDHAVPQVNYLTYIRRGHFLEAVAENWESEFLQMGAFVVLTAWFRQKGSAESKKLDGKEPVDKAPQISLYADSPWRARLGELAFGLYKYSLSTAFLLLFLVSFILHGIGGAKAYNEDQLLHGQQPISTLAYMGSSQFWFESFQNWQSEFLAVGCMVVLTIFLRQRGSAESKPVDAPWSKTGKG